MTHHRPRDYPLWFRVIVVLTLALLAINSLFFLAPAATFISWAKNASPFNTNDILAGLGTLTASFAGAWFAFKFAKLQRDKERTDDEVTAGNRALYTLTEINNSLLQHQQEAVEKFRG